MSSTQAFPLASSIIIIIFAALVLRRYAMRRSTHLLVWGVGLLMFGVASLAEAYSTLAWHPLAFRLWYLAGAVLSAAWIGQGSVHLLAGIKLPNILTALVFGYGLAAGIFLVLGRLGLGAGAVAVLISFHGLIFAGIFWRRLVRRWDPVRLARLLTLVLIASSVVAAYLVFAIPLDAQGFNPAEPLSAQYRDILPTGASLRKLTPAFNIYGTLALVGGALYSAWMLARKQTAPNRVAGNVLIALGALLVASTSAMVRLDLADYLYLGQLLAAALMFSGFLLATARTPIQTPVEAAKA